MSRKICVITGSRAEYGLLRWVMEGIRSTAGLELQVVATGMHLSSAFGSTYLEIERDGFRIILRNAFPVFINDMPLRLNPTWFDFLGNTNSKLEM